MPRVETVRSQIQNLLRSVPFHPFTLNMENGDRLLIEHPENIAFEPSSPNGSGGSNDFHVVSRGLRVISTFNAVTSVALIDRGESAA